MDRHPLPKPIDDLRDVTERERLRTAYPHRPGVERDEPLGWVAGLLALFGPLLVWATGVCLAAGAVPSKVGAGECEGIGFGCQLTPHDGVLFLGGFLGLFIVPAATVATMAVGTRGPGPGRLGRVTVVLVLLAFGAALFGAALVGAAPNR